MSLSHEEARESLRNVERAERRSTQAYGYQASAPHLIIWGLVWLFGYGATDLHPDLAAITWPGLILAGVIAGAIVGSRSHRNRTDSSHTWRFIALAFVIFVFIAGTMAILQPATGAQQGAFVPLLVGTIYVAMGLWVGARFIAAGIAIIALTLGGYFFLHEHFLLWMAFVGGGGLILAGFWFRQA
jgi:hypothetical protein